MAFQTLLKLTLLTTLSAASIAFADEAPQTPAAPAAPQTPAAPLTCDSQKAIETLHQLGNKNRGRIYIHNMQYMFLEKIRNAIREYWTAAKTCPSKEVVKVLVQELQAVGYPNEYLESVLVGLGSDHGLKTFELGDAWNKEPVSAETLTTPARTKLYNNIAIMGLNQSKEPGKLTLYSVGTGFVIGRDGQKLYIGTARHVVADNAENIPLEDSCSKFNFHFPAIGKKKIFQGSRLIVAREDIDFAICELILPDDEVTQGILDGLTLNTRQKLPKNLPLATMGFNSHNKTPGVAHIDESDDCRLFVASKDMRKIESTTWLLPTACDVASGDSGSPVIARGNQEVLGVMVKTTTVKSGMTSKELRDLQKNPKLSEGIWQEGSMMVPFIKIRELLCPEATEPLNTILKCQQN